MTSLIETEIKNNGNIKKGEAEWNATQNRKVTKMISRADACLWTRRCSMGLKTPVNQTCIHEMVKFLLW